MALSVAGRIGDGWFPTAPTPDAFASGWSVVTEKAEASGRDPARLIPAAYLNVNLDPERGPDEVRTYAQDYYGLPFEVMSQVQGYFVGEPSECVEWLTGFADAGVRHMVIRFATLEAAPHLESLAATVLPALREHSSI